MQTILTSVSGQWDDSRLADSTINSQGNILDIEAFQVWQRFKQKSVLEEDPTYYPTPGLDWLLHHLEQAESFLR